ncbi:MAG TPA: PLDc N-terminal domain-containing protein [Chitinophagaceae bacterium]|nr:PLDc N-terminal domain-containing protein [Chitinophagaceae bacterium]
MDLLSPETSILFWTIFGLVLAVLPIIALINLLPNKAIENVTKLIWVIVIIFVPVIGSILFFLIGPVRKWSA